MSAASIAATAITGRAAERVSAGIAKLTTMRIVKCRRLSTLCKGHAMDFQKLEDELTAAIRKVLAAYSPDTPIDPDPPAPEEPTPEPEPESPPQYTAEILSSTDTQFWDRGISRNGNTFMVRNTPENKAAFASGVTVTLQDGSTRTVSGRQESGWQLHVHVGGGKLDPDKVGHPGSVSVGASSAPAPEQPAPTPTPTPKPPADSPIKGWNRELWFMGMNQAAGDFAGEHMPGTFNTHYTYPNYNHLKGARDKGFYFARFPFKRGRLQHSVRGPLNATEVGRVRKFLDDCHSLGMSVKTDPHDYFKIQGREATAVELIDFHLKFLDEFGSHPAIVMIGLQNEPTGTGGRWNRVADELVREIRKVTGKLINVPGDSYQSVTRWMNENPLYPLDYENICYGGHTYFDHDASGTWNRGRTAHVDPMQGVRMLEGWIKNFLEPNDCYGHIGEVGVPWENPSALLALDNFLAFAKSQPRILGVTYWADGPWWGVNKEGIPPVNAIRSNGNWHEPTLEVVQKYVKR